jgi:hypothetical protein
LGELSRQSTKEMERVTGLEPATFSLGSKLPLLCLHNLRNRSGKINVHAVPDLRPAGGRFGGQNVLSFDVISPNEVRREAFVVRLDSRLARRPRGPEHGPRREFVLDALLYQQPNASEETLYSLLNRKLHQSTTRETAR